VKRVLLTGMSGTGKSSVISELAALGFKAVDTDDGWCEPLPDGRQRWREDAIAELLDTEDADVVFVARGRFFSFAARQMPHVHIDQAGQQPGGCYRPGSRSQWRQGQP
jgi:hypothetical protein